MTAGLAWLGRQGTRAIAALVVIGIALPPLGAALKPFVAEAIFILLAIAFLRVDPAALGSYVRRPAIVLVTLIAASALTPLTAPMFAYAFVGRALTLSPLALGVKLLLILAGSALVGLVIRRIVGAEAIGRHRDAIDGVNILVALVFVAAVMENVAARFVAAPLQMLGLVALGFVVFFAILGATTLVFARGGHERAFALGFLASQRNMGLMLAATGGALPDLAWLYFAACQLPIYLSPQLLKPLARRLPKRDDG